MEFASGARQNFKGREGTKRKLFPLLLPFYLFIILIIPHSFLLICFILYFLFFFIVSIERFILSFSRFSISFFISFYCH